MNTCEVCRQEMLAGGSCIATSLTLNGQRYLRLRHETAEERACWREVGVTDEVLELGRNDNCGDCGVAPGGFHHPGCDMERCPGCHRQLIGCDCQIESRRTH